MRTKDGRVTTLHPAGKQGVNVEVTKYEPMRRALLRVIPRDAEGVPFGELSKLVGPHLSGTTFGEKASRTWYVTTVKQDLEARGLIEQVPGARPQRLRRTRRAKA